MHRTFCIALIISASLATGCASRDAQLALATQGAPVEAGLPADFTPEGTWSFTEVRTSVSRAPFVGEIRTQSRLTGIATITEDASGNYELMRTICSAETLSSKDNIRTSMDEEFLRELYAATLPLEFSRVENQATLHVPETVWVMGAALEDPVNQPLPRDVGDPEVADSDGDGHPGVTVSVDAFVSGELRIAQRVTTSWTSHVVSPDYISGIVAWSDERVILAATADALARSRDSHPSETDGENAFELERLSPDESSCTQSAPDA